MSETETIENLKRLNEKLRSEKEAAVQRAARRHRDMVHANRRAERAEQAFKKEAYERRDDQVKATALFCIYKDAINALELAITQGPRSGPSEEQIQAMKVTNARLEAAIVGQREHAVRLRTSAEETIRGLHVKTEADKSQLMNEAAQHYEKRLAEMKKQLSEDFSRKAQVGMIQIQKMYQACKAENESLKQKLQQATLMVDWQRKNTQQQASERLNLQSQPRGAGIHAGFPLPPQRSPVLFKETANKRRKLDSIGLVSGILKNEEQANGSRNAGIITPDRQRGRTNSTKSNASASTPKRKAQDVFRENEEPAHQSMTSKHQNIMQRQQQRPNLHASPTQHQRQPQPLPPHLQDIPQAQQLFSGFIQQLNTQRVNSGQTELGSQEALPFFNQWVAQKLRQRVPASSSNNTVLQAVLQHSESSQQTFGKEEGSRTGLQLPPLSTNTPFDPQILTPFNMMSPPSGQTTVATQMHQIHQTHGQEQQRHQQEYLQNMLPLSEIPGQSPNNEPSVLLTGHDATLPVTFSNDTILTQSQATPGAGDTYFDAQLAFQLGNGGTYPSPEDSERAQDIGGVSFPAQPSNWGSPALKNGSGSLDMGNTRLSFTNSDSYNIGADFDFGEFSTTTGAAGPSSPFTQTDQSNPVDRINQQNQFSQPQQHSQFQAIDPALLFNNEAYIPAGSFTNQPSSSHDQVTSLQHSMNGTRTPSDQNPSPAPPPYQPTSRKRPAPPPSSHSTPAPSSRSTPAPTGPPLVVCLHCHENWWNDSCDAGEPCQNCIGSDKVCQRPQCLNFAMGTCNSARCPRVHGGDMRYRNVVAKPKTLKRIGKKGEQKPSPSILAHQEG